MGDRVSESDDTTDEVTEDAVDDTSDTGGDDGIDDEAPSGPGERDGDGIRAREIVLLVVAVLGIAGTIFFGLRWKELDDAEADRAEVEDAASEFLDALFTWDGTTVDADFDRILAYADRRVRGGGPGHLQRRRDPSVPAGEPGREPHGGARHLHPLRRRRRGPGVRGGRPDRRQRRVPRGSGRHRPHRDRPHAGRRRVEGVRRERHRRPQPRPAVGPRSDPPRPALRRCRRRARRRGRGAAPSWPRCRAGPARPRPGRPSRRPPGRRHRNGRHRGAPRRGRLRRSG